MSGVKLQPKSAFCEGDADHRTVELNSDLARFYEGFLTFDELRGRVECWLKKANLVERGKVQLRPLDLIDELHSARDFTDALLAIFDADRGDTSPMAAVANAALVHIESALKLLGEEVAQ